eukprot:1520920-Lingulodinium_polyedra.AAC.1
MASPTRFTHLPRRPRPALLRRPSYTHRWARVRLPTPPGTSLSSWYSSRSLALPSPSLSRPPT